MTEEQEERLVAACEEIGKALSGLREEAKRAGARYWPQQREQRETVLTRVETDEEREKKMQGARWRLFSEILDPNAVEEEEDESVGARSHQWLKEHPPEKPKTPEAPVETR
jgi:hypothetical protein